MKVDLNDEKPIADSKGYVSTHWMPNVHDITHCVSLFLKKS